MNPKSWLPPQPLTHWMSMPSASCSSRSKSSLLITSLPVLVLHPFFFQPGTQLVIPAHTSQFVLVAEAGPSLHTSLPSWPHRQHPTPSLHPSSNATAPASKCPAAATAHSPSQHTTIPGHSRAPRPFWSFCPHRPKVPHDSLCPSDTEHCSPLMVNMLSVYSTSLLMS